MVVDIAIIDEAAKRTKLIWILLGTSIFFNLIVLLFVGDLIQRHIWLQRQGISQYEYIRIQEGKQAEESKITKKKTDR